MTIGMEYALVRHQYITDYQKLREIFLNTSKRWITSSNLNTLKMYYSNVINSSRVYDYITSIEELLRILEKRNALSYDNIEALKYISLNFVKDSILERAIADYETKNILRRSLPPCNVYDLPSGKYSVEELRTTNSTSKRLVNGANFFENINKNYETSTPEEDLINENNNLLCNISSNLRINERNIDNRRLRIMKVRKKICSNFGFWVAATFFFIGSLILFITIINLQSIKSLASEYHNPPNVSGVETNYNQSQQSGEDVHATMTLFTTQPAFQLTLPGSIRFTSTTQKSNENDSEHMRMVLLEISDQLGRHWRDVARFLRVKESEIDELDSKNLSLKEKSFKALQIFQRKCDPLQWKTQLKRALDMARRRDLMDLVDK